MTERCTHEMLAGDVRHLEGRMKELRSLFVDGVSEIKKMLVALDERIDGRITDVETRVRGVEIKQATSDGQHKTEGHVISWITTGTQGLVIGVILALAQHFMK